MASLTRPSSVAAISVWGASRVGLHLAPRGDSHDIGDSDPKATFGYVARQAGKRGLAFIFTREHPDAPRLTPHLKAEFGGALITNEGLDAAKAQDDLVTQIKNWRSSTSGVDWNEELTNMIKFQQGYSACSRCLTTMDEMLDKLVNSTGTIGR